MNKKLFVVLLATALFFVTISYVAFDKTIYVSTAKGYVGGCYESYYDIYAALGLKQVDKPKLIKFCEDKWDSTHTRGH